MHVSDKLVHLTCPHPITNYWIRGCTAVLENIKEKQKVLDELKAGKPPLDNAAEYGIKCCMVFVGTKKSAHQVATHHYTPRLQVL